MAPSSAAKMLRDSFGDRKIPEISRKITACVSCRKLKIKCQMDSSGPPCRRCKGRGLSCTVNKSLQMLLENDASWKEKVEARLLRIENMMENSTSLSSLDSADIPTVHSIITPNPVSNEQEPEMDGAADDNGLNLSCSLGAFPATSMPQHPPDTLPPGQQPDLISRGVIGFDAAKELFNSYQQHLDPQFYDILAGVETLQALRARSSILTAAVCTTSAFCTKPDIFPACIEAFKREVSGMLFSSHYNFDDVRALCIGAMWLRDISSTLNGLAVRIGTQLDLHRCITKMPHTKRSCYNRTRLFFQVYLCDHYSSLVYGRPPMTREWASLQSPSEFLRSKFSTSADTQLIGLVELWSIGRQVFKKFGADVEAPILDQKMEDLIDFQATYASWDHEWHETLKQDAGLDSYSKFSYDFHLLACKLFLHSHIFRGGVPDTADTELETRFRWFAQDVSDSAQAIIRLVNNTANTSVRLDVLPSYFGTMVAFATVCLIRVPRQDKKLCSFDATELMNLLRQLIDRLRRSMADQIPRSAFSTIAESVQKVITTYEETNPNGGQESGVDFMNTAFDFDLFADDPMNFNLFANGDFCATDGQNWGAALPS